MLAFFRFLAAVFLLIAVLAAVYDGTRTIAADKLVTTSLLEHWSTLAPTLLNTARRAVKRCTHPLVWDVGLGQLLLLPAWARVLRARRCSLPMPGGAAGASTCSPTESIATSCPPARKRRPWQTRCAAR